MIKFYTKLNTRHYKVMLLAFLSLFFLSGSLFAQVATKYVFSSSTNNAYNPITGGTVLNVSTGAAGGSVDDDDYFYVPFGFSFFYNGISYTHGWVNCNGYVKLGANPPQYTYSFGPAISYEPITISAFSNDLAGKGATSSTSNLRVETQGTAPYRVFVVQFKDWTVYNGNATIMAGETYNFQIKLNENDGNGFPQICYGKMISNFTSSCQVGISGNAATDYNVRTTSWVASTASTTNAGYSMPYSSTNVPDSGLTYKWAIPPQKMVIDSVTTIGVSGGIAPASFDNAIIAAVVYTKGDSAKKFITEINFNTTGTTSISDITAAKVYFSGTNSVFSALTATQFGNVIFNPPTGTLTFTGLDSLNPGANYFWLVYDVSSGATVGNFLDGQCINVKDSILYTNIPLVTSPAGSRQIVQPMSGIYTINAAGSGASNFTTFDLAFAAMNVNGLSGPVTFRIAANTYTRTTPLIINSVPGLSSTNTITFEGVNKATTILTGSLLSSQIVQINAKYITLRNLTITNTAAGSCSGVTLLGSSSSNVCTGTTVNNCIINLPNATAGSGAAIGMTIDVTGNSFGTSVLMDSVTVDSNVINGGNYAVGVFGALNISFNRAFKFRNNTVTDTKANTLWIQYVMNTVEVLNNNITLSAGSGIYFFGCEGNSSHLISGNKISGFTAYGIEFRPNTGAGPSVFPNRVYNNLVVSGASGAINCFFSSLPTPTPLEMYHNTFIYNTSSTTATYGPVQTSGSGFLTIRNNIFVNNATSGTNSTMYLGSNPAPNNVNYNIYYNRNAANINLVNRLGTQYTTTTFKTTTAGGDSSYNTAPVFDAQNKLTSGCSPKSNLDLTYLLPKDVNGVTRVVPSYIGAHESSILGNDLSIDALLSPVAPITPGLTDVIVRVKNAGSNPIYSFNINYVHNSSPLVNQSVFQTLASCDTATIVFSQQINLTSSNQIKVYTASPNSTTDDDRTNDTLRAGFYGALSGTYTIGGTNPNFPTVLDAVSSLQQAGVAGPVIFDIAPGTYNGQVIINGAGIVGLSAVNNVVFRGTNAATTVIASAAASQGTIVINQCNYITFRKVTVSNTATTTPIGIAIVGNATVANNGTGSAVIGCVINTPNAGTSTSWGVNVTATAFGNGNTATWADSISIDSNTINGAYYGIFFTGRADTLSNVEVKIRNNSLVSYGYGIYLNNIHNAYDVLNNTVNMYTPPITTGYAYSGIYLVTCTNKRLAGASIRITGNKVYNFQNYGIYMTTIGTAGTLPMQLYNNTVSSSTLNAYRSLHISSTTGAIEIYHNTFVHNFNTPTQSYGAGYVTGAVLTNALIKNNIFANTSALGNTTSLYLASAAPSGSVDYNVYFNRSNPNLVYRAAYYTAANYNTATAGGAASFNVEPTFVNLAANDLRLTSGCLPKGLNLTANVPTDIDGNTRPVTPQIGSSEFLAPSLDLATQVITQPVYPVVSGLQNVVATVRNNGSATITSFNVAYKLNSGTAVSQAWSGSLAPCATATITFTGAQQINVVNGSSNSLSVYTSAPNAGTDANAANDTAKALFGTPMSGTYVVGSAPSDFTTFKAATSDLAARGISGAVVFNVKAGTYNEQVYVPVIQGSSAANTVTFKSQANDRTNVTVNFDAINPSDNYIFRILASNVKLQALTLTALNINNSRVIEYIGTASADSVIDCNVTGVVTGSTATDKACIFASPLNGSLVIMNNTISNGSYGVYLFGTSTVVLNTNTVIQNNIIQNSFYGAIQAYYTGNLKVKNNTMSSTYAYSYVVSTNYGYNGHEVLNNKISAPNGGYGIYTYESNGTSLLNNTFSNNVITVAGSTTAYGIQHWYGNYNNVLNNTINITSTITSGYAGYFYIPSGYNNNKIYNNIFNNAGPGFAIYAYDPAAVGTSTFYNYNLLSTAGTNLGQIGFTGLNYTGLLQWRANSKQDSNSISVRAPFVSASNFAINLTDTNSWFLNGGGVQVAGNSTDVNGNTRSTTLINGAPDMGAYEFTPSAVGPKAVAIPAAPAAGTTQVFLYGLDTIAKITWGAFAPVPSSIVGRMYTGAYPAGISGNSHHSLNSYWDFDVPAGTYSYDISLYYKERMLGSVPSEASMVGAKKSGTFPWNVYSSASTVDAAANILTITGLTDFSLFTGTTTTNPVPVKLNEFKAVAMGNDVLVYWNTASERNASHFNVEASVDGRNFTVVGTVEAKGNSSVSNRYNFTHANAQRQMSNASVIYYRLTSVDRDRTSSKSSVVIVSFERSQTRLDAVNAYPNPFAENITVSIPSIVEGAVKIEVMDIQGKLVNVTNSTIVQGANEIVLNNMNTLEKGVYFVKVTVNNESKVVKVVKH